MSDTKRGGSGFPGLFRSIEVDEDVLIHGSLTVEGKLIVRGDVRIEGGTLTVNGERVGKRPLHDSRD